MKNEELKVRDVIEFLENLDGHFDMDLSSHISLIKQQAEQLEAAQREIERLNQYVEKLQTDYCDLSKINHSNMLNLNIQKGWQLVPTDPTADMLHEMRDTTLDYELDDLDERRMSKSLFNAVYKAMLKAAPKPEDKQS